MNRGASIYHLVQQAPGPPMTCCGYTLLERILSKSVIRRNMLHRCGREGSATRPFLAESGTLYSVVLSWPSHLITFPFFLVPSKW
ncbi:hypothetical protein IF2G_04298 [Cordyceps javanica]|nr:hypothetical protein IF2G_04298 [Cordyceps javanica]